ncbi:MAG: hypothetical protein KJP23_20190, partial [Deltaproteobacteria bacterium]|nr:hypothetical protein [Deltaproteobacteria bacterium]
MSPTEVLFAITGVLIARLLYLSLGLNKMNKPEITQMAEFILEIESLAKSTNYAEDRSIYEKILSQSAGILAKLVKDQPVGDDISSMEELFGNTRLKD